MWPEKVHKLMRENGQRDRQNGGGGRRKGTLKLTWMLQNYTVNIMFCLVSFWLLLSSPFLTCSINRIASVRSAFSPVCHWSSTATWHHCWHGLLHTKPECPAQRMPVWIRFLQSVWFFERRLTHYLSQGSQTGCLWAKSNLQKFIWQQTFHSKHRFLSSLYPAWHKSLYCLSSGIVLAILILVLGLIKEVPCFDSHIPGLWTRHFQVMQS